MCLYSIHSKYVLGFKRRKSIRVHSDTDPSYRKGVCVFMQEKKETVADEFIACGGQRINEN